MYTPPYDVKLRRFRENLRTMPFETLQDNDLVLESIHEIAREYGFDFVCLSPYWAAHTGFDLRGWGRRLQSRMKACGIDLRRLAMLFPRHRQTARMLLEGGVKKEHVARLRQQQPAGPTLAEGRQIDRIRKCLDKLDELTLRADDEMRRVAELTRMMQKADSLFTLVMGGKSHAAGVTVFKLK